MKDTLLSVKEVAGIVDVSERTVRRWMAEGKLPYKKFQGRVYILETDIPAFLRKQK